MAAAGFAARLLEHVNPGAYQRYAAVFPTTDGQRKREHKRRARRGAPMSEAAEAAAREKDLHRGALSLLLTTIEREVASEVAAVLRARGWSVESRTHDGMLVRRRFTDPTQQTEVDYAADVAAAEASVRDKLGPRISIKVKSPDASAHTTPLGPAAAPSTWHPNVTLGNAAAKLARLQGGGGGWGGPRSAEAEAQRALASACHAEGTELRGTEVELRQSGVRFAVETISPSWTCAPVAYGLPARALAEAPVYTPAAEESI